MAIAFVVPGNPIPTARPRVVRTNGRARAFTPARSNNYQTTVAFYARHAMSLRAHGLYPIREPVRVVATFFRGDARACDLDNLIKSALDGMTKAGIWQDDAQVYEIHAVKAFSREEPRAEITVLGLDERMTDEMEPT